MYSHKSIKRFGLDGIIYDDSKIPSLREEYIRMLSEMMRAKGFLVRYGIDPDFTVEYNGTNYNFRLSLYGVYVGRKKAECYKAMDKNKLIAWAKSTPKNKLEDA